MALAHGGWRTAYWILLITWFGCAVLDMAGIRAGWLTSYGADLTQPAWLYIVVRSLDNPNRRGFIHRWFGPTAEIAALVIFLGSAATELSQYYWPRGIFHGTFDPLDILAFGLGVAICYGCERRAASSRMTRTEPA